MQKFIAKLVFRIDHSNATGCVEFDKQFRIIEARNYDEAFMRARLLGVKSEQQITNDDGFTLSWIFVDVALLFDLSEARDGDEVFTESHEADVAADYEKYVHHLAETIQKKHVIPEAVSL